MVSSRGWEPEPCADASRARVGQVSPLATSRAAALPALRAWVPPWADPGFFAFLEEAPLPKVALEALPPRPFSLEALKRRVALEGFGLRFMERLKGRAG